MSRYVMAHIQIPILVSETGKIEVLNEYTRTEISGLDKLPAKPADDNMYAKIMDFLRYKNVEEKDDANVNVNVDANVNANVNANVDANVEESSFTNVEEKVETSVDEKYEAPVEFLYLTEGQLKKRSHTQFQSFKNIKKQPKHYTRKNLL